MPSGPVLVVGGETYPLHEAETVVGRRATVPSIVAPPGIDLGPHDGRHVVSRLHARLECAAGAVYLRDLGSRNGTLVNDDLLLHSSMVRLKDGDRISFGGVQARFQAEGPWPSTLTAAWTAAAPGGLGEEATLPGPRQPR